ncbi:MAG: xanthine dehydrogenase family protein molybdopterin-binding subunit [Planctomycetota bacterium]|jgi:xanthine dehydrogenase YagR molybdenum-binding subunit|nr:xanthine dehydrogenase family protein molybdopterin-binding subunit [Planctomycetota bacterium]
MTSARNRPEWGSNDTHALLNSDIPRVDGPEKVTGRAIYTHDIRLPQMVYARLVVCPYPRAKIKSQSYRKARKVPGVVHGAPFKEVGDSIAFQGADGVVGAIVAETPEAAAAGLCGVKIDYEVLEPVVTPEDALAPGAPVVGRRGNVTGLSSSGDRAEVEAALSECAAVVRGTFRVPVQHHVSLETHGVVVDYRGGNEATVYFSTQGVTGSNREFASHLDLPSENVRVVAHNVGGGFGAKFGGGIEGRIACELALELRRPVHLMLTREDEFLMAGNRSGSEQRVIAGASRDGVFKALAVEADRHGGVGRGALPTPPYIYSVGNTYSEIRSVHTATDSSRAMRAPGHPQASFAMESVLDELAYGINMDPVEFRKKNLADPVYHRQLDRVAKEIGWLEHPHRTQPGVPENALAVGIGFGVAIWGSRSRDITVVDVRIGPDGSVLAATGVQDIGQGARTLVAAIVAEELGLAAHEVSTDIGDSRLPPSVASGGSVTTGSLGPSVKDGAFNARVELAKRIAPMLDAEPEEIRFADHRVFVEGDSGRSVSWKQACASLGKDPLQVSGRFQPHLRDQGIHGAQAAKVEVDLLTGRVTVLKMVSIQDQGLPLNRMAIRSQMNGGMIQALSFALFEERVLDKKTGLMLSGNLENYKIAGCGEMPELVAIIDDEDTREAVMGMAEASNIPGHSAIGNAIYNACGLRLREMPFTPARVLQAKGGMS